MTVKKKPKRPKLKTNVIYQADCISVLPREDGLEKIPDSSVDLVYLDPPFFSGKNYDIVWGNGSEIESYTRPPDGVDSSEVFLDDTMYWSEQTPDFDSIAVFVDELIDQGLIDVDNRQEAILKRAAATRGRVGKGAIQGYLDYMAPRLRAIRKVLKETGSVYLHCDWHANAHLRILMDQIFGAKNFQNEIVWCYRTGGVSKKRWGRKHDTLLHYGKTPAPKFNIIKEKVYYNKPFFKSTDGYHQDEDGKWYTMLFPRDVWEIKAVLNVSKEYLGYPTQKPQALAERLIMASSDEDDVVLDPFAGGGTTLAVAHNLGRRWIGIDVSPRACDTIRGRLKKLGAKVPPRIRVAYDPSVEKKIEMTLRMLREQDWQATEEWVRQELGFVKNRTSVRYGIDGIKGKKFLEVKDWSAPVGKPVVEKLAGEMVRRGATEAVIVGHEFSGGVDEAVRDFGRKGLNIEIVYFSEIAGKTIQTKLVIE